MAASIRADLTLGTAYGLAASAVVWSLVLAPPASTANDALVIALSAAVGAVATAFRGRLRVRPIYPVAIAGLLLSGPFVSCAAACACLLGGTVRAPHWRAGRGTARIAIRLSRVTLASAAAAGAFALAGGSFGLPGLNGELVMPIAAHATAFAVSRAALVFLTALGIGRRARASAMLRSLAITVPGCIVGTAVGWAAAAAFAGPASRPLLLAALALAAAWSVHRLRGERLATGRRHEASQTYVRRAMTRALARLMEERDPSTQDHLNRVHRLCIGVGRGLGMSDSELETLGSAALLHDIGKVSVPESILSKPGKLTTDEMERVKRHAVIGAEIAQSLPFRHSLTPLIRHHHERWDGDGYPDGLSREQIPLGARILSAVDCYDALTSERPYRRALDHREAVAFLERESGRMFDPEVVDALLDYLEARQPAVMHSKGRAAIVEPQEPEPSREPVFAASLAVAQQELETFYDISRAMGYGLNLEEFLTLAGCRLSSLVPYQSLVIYFADHDARLLRAHFAMGRAADKLRLMTVPIGERLSGWAAAQHRAVIGRDHLAPLERDGSRSDLEDWDDDEEVSSLRATLAVPMVAEVGLVGVVTLYDAIDRGFTEDDKRILTRVAGYIAQIAALEGEEAAVRQTSLTDPLTGVPNARFLWLESAHRVTRPEEGFGLVAFRVGGLDRIAARCGNETVDRMLCEIARRFAAGCRRSETLVRFGEELFVVMTPPCESGELVQRWHELAAEVERPLPDPESGEVHRPRVTAAHAAFPEDGANLDALLGVLDRRLSLAGRRGRTVVPFRPPQPASAGGEFPR